MASDNIKKMVADSDDDPTAELSILPARFAHLDEQLEADADTFSFEAEDTDGKSPTALRSELRERDASIDKLQFDIEQLRARWTGLEKEIKAREELTRALQAELGTARKALASKDEDLSAKAEEISSLAAELRLARDAATEAAALERRLADVSAQSAEDAKKIAALEESLAANRRLQNEHEQTERQAELDEARLALSELESRIDRHRSESDAQLAELQELRTTLRDRDAELARLAEADSQKRRQFQTAERRISELEENQRETLIDSAGLHKRVRDAERAYREYQSHERAAHAKQLSRQAGQLAARSQEIRDLKEQISRSERYADSLRSRMSSMTARSAESTESREELKTSLERAQNQVRDLREQLEGERLLAADLAKTNEDLRESFEEEMRRVRFELDTAQRTIVENETVNEQLTSDLIDNRGFREALESQLAATEEDLKTQNRRLEKKIRQLERRTEDNEHKLRNKDRAISALLSELTGKSKALQSLGEMEEAIHDIDSRMSERIEEQGGTDRERPARLLIGRIDGQELRFPLFKDRLTIGRTSNNDIQLKAQYISRRHALIVTSDDGTRIVDWGSRNGVAVNGTRVTERRLRSGDKVTIGTAEFVYEERPKR